MVEGPRCQLSRLLARTGHIGTRVARRARTMTSRLVELKEDIAQRIRPVMRDLPEAEFDALVERMAELQYKYEQRRRADLFESDA